MCVWPRELDLCGFPRFFRRNDAKERPAGCGNSKNDCLTPSSTGQAFLVLSHEHQPKAFRRPGGDRCSLECWRARLAPPARWVGAPVAG